jgi:hypothetical protein
LVDIIREVPSPNPDIPKAEEGKEKQQSANIPLDLKFNYNLNESSSDTVGSSDDSEPIKDDMFTVVDHWESPKARMEEDLKKVIKKRVKDRELKLNNLSVGDEFIEAMSDLFKNDNNIQKVHLSNNKISTRGAIAIFNKISNSWYFLDISSNPDISRDAYKFLSRYVLKDYRK